MVNFILWLIVIPMIVYAFRFWWGVGKWTVRNKQTLGGRVERLREAFAEERE